MRDRETHNKQKGRENYICQSHSVHISSLMTKPLGDICEGPEIVYKDHQQHGQCPEYVNGF
jgi:hypothetical protein